MIKTRFYKKADCMSNIVLPIKFQKDWLGGKELGKREI